VREEGTINPDYPHALPVLYGITEDAAERLRTLLGTLIYEGGLEGRLVYTGPINDEGLRWHEADQRTQVEEGIDYLRAKVSSVAL